MVDKGNTNFMLAQQLKAQLAIATNVAGIQAVLEALGDE
jgi:hypothetical protein